MKAKVEPNQAAYFEDFPYEAASDEQLVFLLRFAARAPSSFNTQPWVFRVQGAAVELIADLSRSRPIADAHHRELVISCGAALHHLRVAARYFGLHSYTQLLPNEQHPWVVARFSLGDPRETHAEDILLFNAIPKRCTHRLPFQPDPVPNALLKALAEIAKQEGAWLKTFQDEESRFKIADVVSAADLAQWSDKDFRHELAQWLVPNDSARGDGIPGYARGIGSLMSRAESSLVRALDFGRSRAAQDWTAAIHSPILAVLGTEGDSRMDWLRAGQALSAILLRAQVEDVSASFFNQAVEVPHTRARLEGITGAKGAPQVLLRLGFGREARPTPRRALLSCLLRPQNRPIRLTPQHLA